MFDAIAYPSDGKRAHLVMGRDPTGSARFVIAIGNVYKKLNEKVPDEKTGIPLNLNEKGKYLNKDFNILEGS